MSSSRRHTMEVLDGPAEPPRPPPGRWRSRVDRQTLLVLLVSVALCGVAVEAAFIYRLYRSEPVTSASSGRLTAGECAPTPSMRASLDIVPSKPVAHLTDGQDVVHGDQTMAWSLDADPLLHQMDYRGGALVVQNHGFYFVYSKVSFSDGGPFHHSVQLRTSRLTGGAVPLLASRHSLPFQHLRHSSSYLGGVFLLYKDDTLSVKVSNTSRILRHKSVENFFGVFVI
ncbi:tumor necrosis factor ligand superfamily member 6-like [Pempheris klunzingeri]|uniref:tumor necrosis factor ligand superfamily member 6-like n=1 Tax=Pempheris klunzingeri TaxID=3127111 RepID=UPI00397F0D9E